MRSSDQFASQKNNAERRREVFSEVCNLDACAYIEHNQSMSWRTFGMQLDTTVVNHNLRLPGLD